MKKFLIYSSVVMVSLAFAAPALGAGIILPSAPVPPGPGLTFAGIVDTVTRVVNYLIILASVLAVAAFVYGGVIFAIQGPEKGKPILLRAAGGILAILAVGLVVNTIAAFVGSGGTVG